MQWKAVQKMIIGNLTFIRISSEHYRVKCTNQLHIDVRFLYTDATKPFIDYFRRFKI